ncbi:MAG: hemerythrin domain-containing protein [Rhodospirillales bacterium]
MTDMMQRLGLEHRNMSRLLTVLEQQLTVFERGEHPDYDILQAAADYFTGFPDRCHHPKEDMILNHIRARDPAAAERVGDLEAEHRTLAKLANDFRTTVEQVLQEAELPRTVFADSLRGFIEAQRAHMQSERAGFFLIAEAVLTPDDWTALDAAASDEADPLFGGPEAAAYEALREQILSWQEEDETSAH